MFTNRSESTVAPGDANQALRRRRHVLVLRECQRQRLLRHDRHAGHSTATTTARRRASTTRPIATGAAVDYLKVGDNFNPEVGFVRRDDFRRTFGSLRFSPRPTNSQRVRKFTWEGSLEYLVNGAGQLETRQQSGRFNTEFEKSDQLHGRRPTAITSCSCVRSRSRRRDDPDRQLRVQRRDR